MPQETLSGLRLCAIALCTTTVTFGFVASANAQIVPDDTLGGERSRITPDVPVRGGAADLIDGGASRGSNLFHSFSEFNVNDGQRVYFANPSGIENILGRVTGSDISDILGTLGVDGAANLFLLNPNGIIFGPESSLDVQGSFVVSTGDRFEFADGTSFSATNPEAPPLLSINITPGLQYGTPQANITNQGSLTVGHNLSLIGRNLDLQGQLYADGNLSLQALDTLRIRDSQTTPFIASGAGTLLLQGNQSIDIFTLSHPNSGLFSGGDMILRSANTIAGDTHYYSGGNFHIEHLSGELGDLSSPYDPIIRARGDVTFNSYTGASLHILAGGSVTIGAITITGPDTTDNAINPRANPNLAAITTAGDEPLIINRQPVINEAGQIQRTATGDVLLTTGERLVIDGTAQPTVDIRAGTRAFSPQGITPENPQGFSTIPATDGTAAGANITVGNIRNPSGTILLTNQFQPLVGENNQPAPGNIQVNGVIDANNTHRDINSGEIILDSRGDIIVAPRARLISQFRGNGRAGNITLIAADDITIDNDRTISYSALDVSADAGSGNAGNISLEARNGVIIDNGALLFSNIERTGVGNAGTILINAPELSILRGSVMQSILRGGGNNLGRGSVGSIAIDVEGDVSLEGNSRITISIGIGSVQEFSQSSQIFIRAGTFRMGENSSLATVNFGGQGNTGDINVIASSIQLNRSSINTQVDNAAVGDAGNISLTGTGIGDTITIQAGATLSSQNSGQGSAGNIFVNGTSGDIMLRSARLTSTTFGGNNAENMPNNAGDIFLTGNNVTLQANSILSSETSRRGDSGEIEINATNNFTLDNSGVTTSVRPGAIGNAGSISLNGRAITIQNNARVTSETFGQGNSEDISIGSSNFTLNGSRIATTVQSNATGSGGNIEITANDQVALQNDAEIDASTFSQGSGGRIIIRASDGGTEPNVLLSDGSDIRSRSGATGSGGGIDITARQIQLLRDSSIDAGTSGINLEPNNPDSLSARGGDIRVNVENLTLQQGGQIITSSTSEASAGAIVVNATNQVQIEGQGNPSLGRSSGLLAEATAQGGNAGQITIRTPNLNIENTGRVTASTVSGTSSGVDIYDVTSLRLENGEIVTSTQTGIAGNININVGGTAANGVELQQGGRIAAEAIGDDVNSRAGNIEINARTINLADESEIATRNVASEIPNNEREQFGNIRIQGAIELAATNSLITASTESGTAGSITITANAGENPAVILSGINSTEGTGGVIAEATNGGSAGDIILNTGSLTVNENAQITARSVDLDIDGDEGPDTDGASTGTAGTVDIIANGAVTLTNAQISTTNENALGGQDFGNISIEGATTLSATNSLITASTESGTAGDIGVTASESIVLNGGGVNGDRNGIIAEATNGGNSGGITLTTPSLDISGGARISAIMAGNNPGASAGSININARNVGLSDTNSGIFASTIGAANAGDLTIQPDIGQVLDIDFADGAAISATTSGSGNGGSLILNGRNLINLQGNGSITVASTVANAGNAGELQINTDQLLIDDGVRISATTITSDGTPVTLLDLDEPLNLINSRLEASTIDGNAGNLIILAPSILLSGIFSEDGVPILDENGNVQPAGLFAEAGGTGNAGFIAIGTGELIIENGAQVTVSTDAGTGRTIGIVADSIEVRNPIGEIRTDTGLFAQSGTGRSGNIILSNLDTVTMRNRGQISATTESGTAGTININSDGITANADVEDALEITESDTPASLINIQGNSSISAQANRLGGRAGSVNLNTEMLTVEDGSELSASNVDSDRGGNVNIISLDTLEVLRGGAITASTQIGQAGSVQINTREGDRPVNTILVRGTGSRIAAEATGNGGNAGSVQLNVHDLTLNNGGSITASTQTGQAGNVVVNAREGNRPVNTILVRGTGSRIAAEATGNGGNAGSVRLNVRDLTVSNGGSINVSTRTGRAGNVVVNSGEGDRPAPFIRVTGEESRIAAETTGAGGVAGSVRLNVRDLTVRNAGAIVAETRSGIGGNVLLQNLNRLTMEDSAISASTINGQAGDVNIFLRQGGTVSLDRSGIESAATGTGRAGSLRIVGDTIALDNNSRIAAETRTGLGGDIQFQNLNQLTIEDGSVVSASTINGRAGNINVFLQPEGTVSLNRGAIESAATGRGRGGIVRIVGDAIALRNGSRIAAETQNGIGGDVRLRNLDVLTVEDSAITASSPLGVAGNLYVTAEEITLRGGEIRAQTSRPTNNGQRANIELTGLDFLWMFDESLISAEAQGEANGGNIFIDATNGYVIGESPTNNDIIATATEGNGGQITFQANRIFGFTNRNTADFSLRQLRNNSTSDISANSRSGAAGTIAFNVINVDPTRGLVTLPETGIDATQQVARRCGGAIQDGDELGEFIITGRGGLPPTPADPLGATASSPDLITLDSDATLSATPPTSVASTAPTPIIEAQGWAIAPDGQVTLTADPEGRQSSPLPSITCTPGS